jgi:hypothetical protein
MKADVTGPALRSIQDFCVNGDEYLGRSTGTFLKSWLIISYSLKISVKYCSMGGGRTAPLRANVNTL